MSKKQPPPETALYVRLPAEAGDKLDRAAEALGIRKKELVAGLVERFVDPDSPQGLSTLAGATRGSFSFQPYDAPEVLTAEQAAKLLQIEESLVLQLAEAGKIPGRKLGDAWRFSRAALVAWLDSTGAR